jgi:hypothetical protein
MRNGIGHPLQSFNCYFVFVGRYDACYATHNGLEK